MKKSRINFKLPAELVEALEKARQPRESLETCIERYLTLGIQLEHSKNKETVERFADTLMQKFNEASTCP